MVWIPMETALKKEKPKQPGGEGADHVSMAAAVVN